MNTQHDVEITDVAKVEVKDNLNQVSPNNVHILEIVATSVDGTIRRIRLKAKRYHVISVTGHLG